MHKAPNMFFHNIGLWGSNKTRGSIRLMSIGSIVSLLQHELVHFYSYNLGFSCYFNAITMSICQSLVSNLVSNVSVDVLLKRI